MRKPRRLNFNNAGRRHNSSSSSPSEAQPTSLKERLKKMSREYGWTAVGVYLALSALDFPFCFLAVRLIGTETIGHYEHVVVEGVKGFLKWPIQGSPVAEMVADGAVEEGAGGKELEQANNERKRLLDDKSEVEVVDHGYREAEKANRGDDASTLCSAIIAVVRT
jgi:N-terminal acetyltransferase 2